MCDRIQDLGGAANQDEFDNDQVAASKMKMATVQSLLAKSGCSHVNKMLDECLDKNNREWRFCQDETKLLRECMTAQA